MLAELELALWRLMWRLTWWLVVLVLRIFWLPILVIAAVYFVAVPALLAAAHLAQQLLQPVTAIAVLLLVLWMWRR